MKGYTLKLDSNWDIMVDEAGNLATATKQYAIAQNAANAVRLFRNDAYFAQNKGIPHYAVELGQRLLVSESVLVTRMKKAALSAKGVKDATITLSMDEEKTRVLGGQIALTLEDSSIVNIEI